MLNSVANEPIGGLAGTGAPVDDNLGGPFEKLNDSANVSGGSGEEPEQSDPPEDEMSGTHTPIES